MARYTGPTTKKARSFGEAIYGYDKYFERRKYPPGQHGLTRKKKQTSDYSLQARKNRKQSTPMGYWSVSFAVLSTTQPVATV